MDDIEGLQRFSAIEYINSVSKVGRAQIEPEMQQAACQLFQLADRALANETSLSPAARSTYQLIRDVLYSEQFMSENAKPRYVPYANLLLLNRYLHESQSVAAELKWSAAKRALALIIRDWHDTEQERLSTYAARGVDPTLIGFESSDGKDDRTAHLKERERGLHALAQFTAVADLPDTRIVRSDMLRHKSEWEYFAADSDRQLTHLSCMPRSRWHDELMFIKMIHGTECCYAGILASLAPLPQLAIKGDWAAATETLKTALFFSDFLIKLWAIFNTMPVAHFFDGFREATGEASAIQSVRFQTLDVLTRGLGQKKQQALTLQREAGYFATWQPPKEATLAGLCELAQSTKRSDEFISVAEMLDRDLLQWRSRHFGIARRYLPPEAVGTGSEGISYLANNFRDPLLKDRAPAGSKDHVEGHSADLEVAAPARATSAFRVRRTGFPPIAVVEAKGIQTAGLADVPTQFAPVLLQKMRERDALIRKNLAGYKSFFQPLPYPIERQMTNFQRSASLPKAVVPALLLSVELLTGSLMGLHDASRITGQALFDTASPDESFTGIGNDAVRCGRDELIIRDEKGIIASITQGPDKRTAIQLDAAVTLQDWLLFIMGYPGMPIDDFRVAVADGEELFTRVNCASLKTWMLHEY
jgi:tryptophan 2,3-dioxygenase